MIKKRRNPKVKLIDEVHRFKPFKCEKKLDDCFNCCNYKDDCWFLKWQQKKFSYYKRGSSDFKQYLAGDIIYVDLGFNIGSEFRGAHYAVVLKKSKALQEDLQVVFLTSKKGYHTYRIPISFSKLYGDSLKKRGEILYGKINSMREKIDITINDSIELDDNDISYMIEKIKIDKKVNEINDEILFLEKEIAKYKSEFDKVSENKNDTNSYVKLFELKKISKLRIIKGKPITNISISNEILTEIKKEISKQLLGI
ncbi:MAG: type II toxin-antitoxin system PemK/MazF family toxin [Bacilli bacterium]